MRLLLLCLALFAAVTIVVWTLAGAPISQVLDRVGTAGAESLPVGNYELDAQQFSMGGKRWILGPEARIANDERGRLTLSSNGRTFAFGAVDGGRGASPGSYYKFHPDPGDEISFVARHSWLAWPTPFRFSILGAKQSYWSRHSYRELRWRKRSGAAITMVWPDVQSLFANTGWVDGNLEIAPTITIPAVPDESVVVAHLSTTRSWSRHSYRLENRGQNEAGTCIIVAVIHDGDDSATSPGAGRSVELCVDTRSHVVVREIGAQ